MAFVNVSDLGTDKTEAEALADALMAKAGLKSRVVHMRALAGYGHMPKDCPWHFVQVASGKIAAAKAFKDGWDAGRQFGRGAY